MFSTNVVDVLYAGFPAILYLNPDLGRYLLLPILKAQVSDDGALIGQPYAPQNIGIVTLALLFFCFGLTFICSKELNSPTSLAMFYHII